MALELEPIIAKYVAETDVESFKKTTQFARDNKKALEKEMVIKLQLDVLQIQKQIKDTMKSIKDATGQEKIKLELNLETLKSNLTEAKRQLQNYRNTWEVEMSRLQKKFNDVKLWLADIASWFLAWFWIQQAIQYLWDATQKAREFEKWMWLVNTVLNLNEQQTSKLSSEIKLLSDTYWVATWEIQKLVFEVASAGYQLETIPQLAELSLRWAVATWESATDIFNWVNAVIKAYGLQTADATIIADKFFQANVQGQLTVWELSREIQWVTGSARNLGVNINEVLAWFTMFTGVIGNASEVSTGLWRLFDSLGSPSAQALDVLNKYWISYKKLQDTIAKPIDQWGGYLNAVKMITDALDWNNLALWQVFNNVNAYKIASVIATKTNQDFATSIDWIANSTGALDKALQQMTETQDFQLKVAETQWNNFKITVWNVLLTAAWFLLKFGQYVSILASSVIPQAMAYLLFAFVNGLESIVKNAGIAWENIWIAISNWMWSLWSFVAQVFNVVVWQIEQLVNKWVWAMNKLVDMANKIPWVNISRLSNVSIARADASPSQSKDYKSFIGPEWLKSSRVLDNTISDLSASIKSLWDVGSTEVNKVLWDMKQDIVNQTKDLTKQIKDDQDKSNKKWGWGKQDQAKKEYELKKKSLEDQAILEIQAVKKSELLEIDKANKIIAINDKLTLDKKLLDDEYNKSTKNAIDIAVEWAKDIQKEAEKLQKKQEDVKKSGVEAYKDVNDEIIKSLDSMIKLQWAEDDLRDRFKDLKEEAKQMSQEVASAMQWLASDTQNSLLDRNVEIQKEILSIQKEQQSWDLSDNRRIELENSMNKLRAEQLQISQNTTEESRKQRDAYESLTKAEQILKDSAEKRLALEEKQAIIKSFQSSELWKSNIKFGENADGTLNASYTDQAGKIVEITDLKNIEYARDLANKQLSIEQGLKSVQDKQDKEQAMYETLNKNKQKIDKLYTDAFKAQIAIQVEQLQSLINKQRELNSLRWWSDGSTTTINKEQNNTFVTNSQVDFESQLREISRNI